MVTRRGGNRISLGGRFYFVDSKFQATNEDFVAETKKTEPLFLGINKINNTKDYGFNLGLPVIKDRVWFWMSYGIQDIKTSTVYGTADDTLLENYVGKLNCRSSPEPVPRPSPISGAEEVGPVDKRRKPEGCTSQGRYHFGSHPQAAGRAYVRDNLFHLLKYAYPKDSA
jgi:hypothetical protein